MTIRDQMLQIVSNPTDLANELGKRFQSIDEDLDGFQIADQAAAVADIGVTTNLPTSNFVAAVAAEPTKAEIDTGINTLKTAVESRLDVIEAKVDALLGALRDAALIAT